MRRVLNGDKGCLYQMETRMEQQTGLLQKLGKLAKLEASEKDEKLKEDFKKIVAYMDVIREVDTTGIRPLSHLQFEGVIQKEQTLAETMQSQANVEGWNVFREDEPVLENVGFGREELLQNAPKTEQGYLVVPKTVTE